MASEKDSGLLKAERSTSYVHGRRCARPLRSDSERLLMRTRTAGEFTGRFSGFREEEEGLGLP